MRPTRISLSDARIAHLESTVAKLLGRVTILKALLPSDHPRTSPTDLRLPSPSLAPGPKLEAFAAASFLSATAFSPDSPGRSPAADYPHLDYDLS